MRLSIQQGRTLLACISVMGLLLFCVGKVQAEVSSEVKQEINYLLSYVGKTECLYDRNGTRHTGKEAVEHIRNKYDYFHDDIETAEDFIRLSASKSTFSGRHYQVICPGADTEKSQDWLLRALKRYRKQDASLR